MPCPAGAADLSPDARHGRLRGSIPDPCFRMQTFCPANRSCHGVKIRALRRGCAEIGMASQVPALQWVPLPFGSLREVRTDLEKAV